MKGLIIKSHDYLNLWYNAIADDDNSKGFIYELEECKDQPDDYKLKNQPLYIRKEDVFLLKDDNATEMKPETFAKKMYGKWEVGFNIGNQQFILDTYSRQQTKKGAMWYKRQLDLAFEKLNEA